MAVRSGKQAAVLEAFRSGCRTVEEVEAALDFTLGQRAIGGHVYNLRKAGKLRAAGIYRPDEPGPSGRRRRWLAMYEPVNPLHPPAPPARRRRRQGYR